jgi:hypothetical protein
LHYKDPVKHKYEKEVVPGYYNHNPEIEDYLKDDDKNFKISEIKDNNGHIYQYTEMSLLTADYDLDIEDKSHATSDSDTCKIKKEESCDVE